MMIKHIILLCAVVAACSTAYAARRDSQLEKNSAPVNFCQGCRSFVSYLTHFNSSSKRQDYKKVLKEFCETKYPPSTDYQQGPCPVFVEGTFYIIDQIDPATHCDVIGACGSSDDTQLSKLEDNNIPKVNDGGVCDVCEQMIVQAQAQLENPKFVDIIKRQITSFCDYLAVINEDKECRQILDSYIDQAIEFVRDIQPEKACASIGVCSARLASQKRPIQVPSLASFQGFGVETKVSIGDQVVKDLSAQRGHNPNCMFCKAFVKEMFKFLRENRTEESIKDGLGKVCKLIYGRNPDKLEQCEEFVSAYTKELVQMLVDETDPELICIMIEQCTYLSPILAQAPNNKLVQAEIESTDLSSLISLLDPSIPVGSIGTCVECKLFIEYLRNQIENPKSVDHVKNWLLANLCDSIDDKKSKDSCTAMVNNYADVFFKAIATDMDPKKACIELKACTQRIRVSPLLNNRPMLVQRVKVKKAPTTPKKTSYCEQCVQIITQIDDYLASHPIDHDVSVLIDEVCNKLPNESAKSECTLLVKTFGQDIAQAISTMDSPQQLCSKIMLC